MGTTVSTPAVRRLRAPRARGPPGTALPPCVSSPAGQPGLSLWKLGGRHRLPETCTGSQSPVISVTSTGQGGSSGPGMGRGPDQRGCTAQKGKGVGSGQGIFVSDQPQIPKTR